MFSPIYVGLGFVRGYTITKSIDVVSLKIKRRDKSVKKLHGCYG